MLTIKNKNSQTQAKGGLDFISADTIPPWASMVPSAQIRC